MNRWRAILKALSSVRMTLALLAVTAAIALLGDGPDAIASGTATMPVGLWVALPITGLMINLLAALAVNATLRASPPMFSFHVALALLAALVAADRMTSLNGHVEMTVGAGFDAALVEADAGPWHPFGLDRVAFVQGPFEIGYDPGMKRRNTVSTVEVPDGAGGWTAVQVGDDRPLVAAGYRFYTSFNKGFAPVLSFITTDGRVETGAVHLPSYPLNDFDQGNTWAPPDGTGEVSLWLHIPDPVYDEDGTWHFSLPADARLVVIKGDVRHELAPGESVRAAGGIIRYEELGSWMGYTISSNPLMVWILAMAVAATLAMGWHVWSVLRRPAAAPEMVREGAGHAA